MYPMYPGYTTRYRAPLPGASPSVYIHISSKSQNWNDKNGKKACKNSSIIIYLYAIHKVHFVSVYL